MPTEAITEASKSERFRIAKEMSAGSAATQGSTNATSAPP